MVGIRNDVRNEWVPEEGVPDGKGGVNRATLRPSLAANPQTTVIAHDAWPS